MPRELDLITRIAPSLPARGRVCLATGEREAAETFLGQTKSATLRTALGKQRVEDLAQLNCTRVLERNILRNSRAERLVELVNPRVEPREVVGRLRDHDQAIRIGIRLDREDVRDRCCRGTIAATALWRQRTAASNRTTRGRGARATAEERREEITYLRWICVLQIVGLEDAALRVRWKIPSGRNKPSDFCKPSRSGANGD